MQMLIKSKEQLNSSLRKNHLEIFALMKLSLKLHSYGTVTCDDTDPSWIKYNIKQLIQEDKQYI